MDFCDSVTRFSLPFSYYKKSFRDVVWVNHLRISKVHHQEGERCSVFETCQ